MLNIGVHLQNGSRMYYPVVFLEISSRIKALIAPCTEELWLYLCSLIQLRISASVLLFNFNFTWVVFHSSYRFWASYFPSPNIHSSFPIGVHLHSPIGIHLCLSAVIPEDVLHTWLPVPHRLFPSSLPAYSISLSPQRLPGTRLLEGPGRWGIRFSDD